MKNQIVYEFPLNERMRLFMRLEQLFRQARHFNQGASVWDCRAVVATLNEIVALLSRNDIKSELLKELDRLGGALGKMQGNQHIDQAALASVLSQLDAASQRIYGHSGRIGYQVMENELFKSVAQRTAIPGGTCSFDLPGYHFWLERDGERRRKEATEWLDCFHPVQEGIALILGLLRDSAAGIWETAHSGFFQKNLDHAAAVQLLRVAVPIELPYFAEISGGKHRFTVRFLTGLPNERPVQCSEDVPFQLTTCLL
ncbi:MULTISPECIES: cell division protein ZapD [Methylococcus]|nr:MULTISPECIES: cell division protein ZapD [Methylococcus]MDF9392491.1 cell division protein ZapD [Methylococcus capsulatus]